MYSVYAHRLSGSEWILPPRPVSQGRSAQLQMESHDARRHAAPLRASHRVLLGSTPSRSERAELHRVSSNGRYLNNKYVYIRPTAHFIKIKINEYLNIYLDSLFGCNRLDYEVTVRPD